LFGDHTHAAAGTALARVETGQTFCAGFRFRFPYLLSGEYALEAAIYQGTPERNRMLVRLRDATFLSVQSRHPGGGLVNISMDSIELEVEADAPARSLATPAIAVPEKRATRQP
jgi:lipopolysaccharide transport system ATP-binding protein